MSLPSLPPDALVAVLCRCPAVDHPALRRTCRAVRAALDSDAYKSERASSGFVEVETRLIPGSELYDRDHPDGPSDVSDAEDGEDLEQKKRERREEDLLEYYSDLGRLEEYGVQDINHEIRVDGVVCGSISMVLVHRNNLFHDATDAHSQELTEVGWTLCHSDGRPKMKSIRDADSDGVASNGGFLHVVHVRVNDPAYRAGDCTEVVSRAVRSAIAAPELEDRWTLATAICDFHVYMTPEDTRLYHELREAEWQRGDREGGRPEGAERIANRQTECLLLDARTYLRAGFRQIPEVVGSEKDQPVWLFALRRFLGGPLLTAAEAADVALIGPPELPPAPEGVDLELLQLIKRSSNSVRVSLDGLARSERQYADGQQQVLAQLAQLNNMLEGDDISEQLAEAFQGVRRQLDEFRAMRDEASRQETERVLGQRREINERINAAIREAKVLVNERGASVRASYAINCAARLRIPELVDALLDLVPSQERNAAISAQDNNGVTPLHCALLGTPELYETDEYRLFAQHLLNRGADSNARDTFDRSALGQHRMTMSSRLNFSGVFGFRVDEGPEAWRPYHNSMEQVLKPTRGETDADRDAMPSAYGDDANARDVGMEDDVMFDDDDDMLDDVNGGMEDNVDD
ncbi:hypothetical protein ACHAXT_002022 [Thalassiosira profunda]